MKMAFKSQKSLFEFKHVSVHQWLLLQAAGLCGARAPKHKHRYQNHLDSSKGPNRVNRAHWPTKENRQNFDIFGPWKNGLGWPQMVPGGFLLHQTLPTFCAEWIWILRMFIFVIFWTLNFWISRSPDLQTPRFPGSQISRHRRRRRRTNSQIPT